jgi:hypothetical protein
MLRGCIRVERPLYRNPDAAFWVFVAASIGWIVVLAVMPA